MLPKAPRLWSRLRGSTFTALLLLATSPLPAADWPMHRGDPQLQGRASEPAPKQPDLKWTFKAGNPVHGSASIVAGKVYFGDLGGLIHCVGLKDGQEIWSFKTDSAIEATPLILDGSCYVGAADGKLYALDATTGKKKWDYETGDKILAGASWCKDPDSSAKWVLVGSYDFSFYALDASSGKMLWKVETENFVNSTPAVTSDGLALFGGCDAVLHVVSLKERKELRKIDAEAYIAASAAADGKMIYFGNEAKKVFAFDVTTGESPWTYHDRNFAYYSSPAINADVVLIGGRDKRLTCINRKDGERKWAFATKADVDSSPVLCSDGGIIVGSMDGRLYCVELADGKERWNYEIGSPISGSPALSDGMIVIGADDGNLYGLGQK